MPYPAAVFSSLSVNCCSSSLPSYLLIDIVNKSQVAKRSPSNCRWGVNVIWIIISRNMLISARDDVNPSRTHTVIEGNLRHFHLATLHWLLHQITTSWLPASCRCCILLRLASGRHARHDWTFSWSRRNYEKAPSFSFHFSVNSVKLNVIWNLLFLFQDLFSLVYQPVTKPCLGG